MPQKETTRGRGTSTWSPSGASVGLLRRIHPFSEFVFRTTLVSHETACILNAGDRQAHVDITLFFADREPVGPYRVTISPRRTLHLRFNDLKEPAAVPRDTDFSSVFEADVPIIVQHTRLDSRHAEVSLLSTTAYAEA